MEATITNMDSIITWHLLQWNNPMGHGYQTIVNPDIVLFILSFIFVIG
jgi:hypothetical protein